MVCPLWQVLGEVWDNRSLVWEQATAYFSSCFWPGLISKENKQILWEVNLINADKSRAYKKETGRLQEIGIKIAKGATSWGQEGILAQCRVQLFVIVKGTDLEDWISNTGSDHFLRKET